MYGVMGVSYMKYGVLDISHLKSSTLLRLVFVVVKIDPII